jgi:hypothetical protein
LQEKTKKTAAKSNTLRAAIFYDYNGISVKPPSPVGIHWEVNPQAKANSRDSANR